MRKDIGTLVVYASINDTHDVKMLHPHERYKEVISCKSERSRAEKYSVWKLLEREVMDELKMDFENIKFTKTVNGKWICPDFYFSLSHTDGAVCVALSERPVGVDIERVRKIREELAKKILTKGETDIFLNLPSEERNGYLLEAWVMKESIFKMTGGEALLPNCTEVKEHKAYTRHAHFNDGEYLISVASSYEEDHIEFYYLEEI